MTIRFSKRLSANVLFAMLVCLLAGGWLFAADRVLAQANINVSISTETPVFNVGDRVIVDVYVTHPINHRVVPPEIVGMWGETEVLDVIPVTIEVLDANLEQTRFQLALTAWEPKALETPRLALEVSDEAGVLSTVSAEPITLNVISVLNDQDVALRDIKPQAAIPIISRFLQFLMIGTAVALAAAVVSLIAYRRSRAQAEILENEPEVDLRPANQIALDEIDQIEKRNLPEEGLFNEHYTQISDALRRYLERSYGVTAMEATTFEIRRLLRKESRLEAGTRQQLINLLQRADLVKFARAKPDLDAATQMPGQARQFVQDSYKQLDAAAKEAAIREARAAQQAPEVTP